MPHPRNSFSRASIALTLVSLGVACSSSSGTSTPPPSSSSASTGVGGATSSSTDAATSSTGIGGTTTTTTSSAGGAWSSTGVGGAATTTTSTSSSASSGAGGMGDPPSHTPSGYLLLSAERLAALEADAASKAPAFAKLKALVDSHLGGTPDVWHDSPENAALVYLLTKDPSYAKAAFAWETAWIASSNVRFDSYLEFGDLMRHAALVLDWCWPALSSSERTFLADYLEQWTEELWFDNQGSGWGLEDPGNNYHHAFLQGTAYAGYALAKAGRPSSSKFLAKLEHHLTRPGGVFEYLATKVTGGDWREGTNYGERSKQRLFDALAVIASMGGPNAFHTHPFFAQAVTFAHYQLQPDGKTLAPVGDLARDSAMPVTASERDYLHSVGAWLGEGPARQLARYYLDEVAPPYTNPYAGLAFKELVFDVPGPSLAPSGLALGYHAPGTGFVNLRSGWDEAATSVTLSAASELEQSHQHHDVGSFVIWKRGWLAMDATTLSKTGLSWTPGAHNAIHVEGIERRMGPAGGLLHFDDRGTFAYAATDATAQYRRKTSGPDELLMSEVTRELVYLRPDTLVVYDRVRAKDPARGYEWRLHLPKAPSLGSTVTVATGSAGLALVPLLPKTVSLANDGDLEGGPSTAFRVAEAKAGVESRFLNVIAVAEGGAPSLSAAHVVSSGAMEGAVAGGTVILFSRNAQGAASALPFSYTVPGTAKRTHILANMATAVDVGVAIVGGDTVVTVSKGSTHAVAPSGVVTFTP